MLIRLPGLLEDKTFDADSREKWEKLDAFVRSFFDFQTEALLATPRTEYLPTPARPSEGDLAGVAAIVEQQPVSNEQGPVSAQSASKHVSAGQSVEATSEHGRSGASSGEVGRNGVPPVSRAVETGFDDFDEPAQSKPVSTTAPVKRGWPERAWLSLGRPATAEEMYAEATRQGYRPTADSPLAAFKRAIRDNPHFVHVATIENGAKVWRLYNTPQVNASVVKNEDRAHGYNTPLGSQISDYAERALLALDQESATHVDLARKMAELGWTTKSPHPAENVRSRLRQDRRWERTGDGRWRLRKQDCQDSRDQRVEAGEGREPVLNYAETRARVGADSDKPESS